MAITGQLTAEPEDKGRETEPRRDELAVVAVLDGIGILVTLVAAVVIGVSGEDFRVWWAVVGIASLLSVVTTVMLVRLLIRRRYFINETDEIIQRLERDDSEQAFEVARALRRRLLATGEIRLLNRLDIAIDRASGRR